MEDVAETDPADPAMRLSTAVNRLPDSSFHDLITGLTLSKN